MLDVNSAVLLGKKAIAKKEIKPVDK